MVDSCQLVMILFCHFSCLNVNQGLGYQFGAAVVRWRRPTLQRITDLRLSARFRAKSRETQFMTLGSYDF